MYAVIETGGKQYRVELGTELEVELLDVEPGQEINLDRVLLVVDGENSAIGRPVVADAAVSAQVLRHTRGPKTISFKYRPKARSRVRKGHRQELTALRIIDVRLGSHSAAADAKVEKTRTDEEKERVSKAAARQAADDQALVEKLKAREAAAEPKAETAKAAPAKAGAAPKAAKPKAEPKAEAAPKAPKAVKTAETAEKAAPKPAARPRTKKDE
jgi:large subunit ribosomal protein L21